MSIASGLAGELKVLAGEASGIAKSFKNLHPEQLAKSVVAGEKGIAATVSKEWSHVPSHWRSKIEIPHADLELLENFASGKVGALNPSGNSFRNEDILPRIKRTIDDVADVAALSRRQELHKPAWKLQTMLLDHERHFHAPDYQKLLGSSAPELKTMLEVRSNSLKNLPEVMRNNEGHVVAGAFQESGGLSREVRADILDPHGTAMQTFHPMDRHELELAARKNIQHLGETITQRTKVAGPSIESLAESVSAHSPILAEQQKLAATPNRLSERMKQLKVDLAAKGIPQP